MSCRNPGVNRIWITPMYRRYGPNTAITIIIASTPRARDQTNLLSWKHIIFLVGCAVRNIPHISSGLTRKREKTIITRLPGTLRLVTWLEITSEFQLLAQIDKALRGEPDSYNHFGPLQALSAIRKGI